jgi:hypothetical protein
MLTGSAAVWQGDTLFNLIDCGNGGVCGFDNLDPSGQYASVNIDGVLGWAGIGDSGFTLPQWNGDFLYGVNAGILAGASGPTLFYRNELDNYNIWVFNQALGFNLPFNDWCAINGDCVPGQSTLRSLGRFNLNGLNEVVFGGTGSSVLGQFRNPDPMEDGQNSAIPEPGTWLMLGGGLASLRFIRRRRSAA